MVTVLRLAVVLIDWMCTRMAVEVPLRLLQRRVRPQQPAVILCPDGLSWDATQITYLGVRCLRWKPFLEVQPMKDVRVLVSQLASVLLEQSTLASAVGVRGQFHYCSF